MDDELTVMERFGAEREGSEPDPLTRAAARQALEDRFEAAAATAAVPAGASRRLLPRRRPRLAAPRRRLLVFAAATAVAAIVAGVLVLGSGPTAQPAAAEVLRQTARVAASADGPSGTPAPGQFLYRRTKKVELLEWSPGEFTASYGGLITSKPYTIFSGFVPSEEVEWRSATEPSRHRWTMEPLRFLSPAERSRWEAAGSPLPTPFSGRSEVRGFPGAKINEARRGVMDVEGVDSGGFADFSGLPTQPKALRERIEGRQDAGGAPAGAPNYGGASAKPVDDGQVIAELWDILDKANTTPELRAAIFGALAEEPEIELNRDATDLIGRPGYAVSYEKPSDSRSEYGIPGVRTEYIFDPGSSAVLGKREVIADPSATPWDKTPPAGTAYRNEAYVASSIVDSTHEQPPRG